MQVIDLEQKLNRFHDHWNPRIIAELNAQHVKLAKLKGEFIWHKHDHEDELFLVIKGQLFIELRDQTLELNEGQMVVIPKGIEHRPIAPEECSVMLFEPASTLNTGDKFDDLTKNELERL